MTSSVCYKCNKQPDGKCKWVICAACGVSSHTICGNVAGIKDDTLNLRNWICDDCSFGIKANKELRSQVNEMKEELKELKKIIIEGLKAVANGISTEIVEVKESVSSVSEAFDTLFTDSVSGGEVGRNPDSWVDVVKKKRKKKSENNLLCVKASSDDEKAVNSKKEISQALSGVQIKDARFTTNGHIVMNFDNENVREMAAEKLKEVSKVTTNNVRKLKPKIMICNIHDEEYDGDKDSFIKDLVDRNEHLQSIENITEKIDLLFVKPAAGGTKHCILKCDPEVRAQFSKLHDKVKLKWGVYKVRDRYHALSCYHCQRYGHVSDKCKDKAEGVSPRCRKCAGEHDSRDCKAQEKKCINCVRYKKEPFNHSVNEDCCPVFVAELQRIMNCTDHGCST